MDDGVLRAGRTRSRMLCWVVRHRWATRHNPEIGGKAAVFHVCQRCGTERNEYDPPSVSQAGGMGAAGW